LTKLRHGAAVLLGAAVLVACGPLVIRDDARREYVPLTRAVLELHRDVDVPPERARVFFQGGQPQPAASEYHPHCELTVGTLVDRPRTIHADRFRVTRFSTDTVHVASSGDVVVAVNVDIQLSSGGGGGSGGDGEGRQMKAYIFYLHSERQPDVLSLVCGGAFDIPARAARPTLQDIAQALGDYATLVLQ
jgi:hypothetical protein